MGNGRRKKARLKESRYELQGKIRGPRKELSETKQKQWVFKAVELMKEVYNSQYITNHILENKQGSVELAQIKKIISEANSLISNEYYHKAKDIKVMHVARYNRQINRLLLTKELKLFGMSEEDEDGPKEDIGVLEIGPGGEMIENEAKEDLEYSGTTDDFKTWLNARNNKIRAYDDVINTMMQKENLLQLVSANFTVEINEEVEVELKEKKETYDFKKLSFAEKVELIMLAEKCEKGKEDDVISVTEITRQEDQVTEDIEAIVLPANVEEIKQIGAPPPLPEPVTGFDPTKKLRESLRLIAAQKIKEIGGNLDPEEQKLIDKNNGTGI